MRRISTLLVRVCAWCRREHGHRLVAWRGSPVVETHILCAPCAERERAAMEAA